MSGIAKLSLRERKKEATRRELAVAAYEVIRDHGVDALSADAVAQRAGVSRRTFFNYFATVEASVAPIVEEFLDEMLARLPESIPAGALMATLAQTVREVDDHELLERFTVIGLMSHRSLSHKALLYQSVQGWQERLSAQVAALTGKDEDELWVQGVTGALHGAAEAALVVWIRRTDGEITPSTIALVRDLLADAIALLGSGFDD
jgi:AcrR family transcriptional regulator